MPTIWLVPDPGYTWWGAGGRTNFFKKPPFTHKYMIVKWPHLAHLIHLLTLPPNSHCTNFQLCLDLIFIPHSSFFSHILSSLGVQGLHFWHLTGASLFFRALPGCRLEEACSETLEWASRSTEHWMYPVFALLSYI